MRALNGIIVFSGGEYTTHDDLNGDQTFKIGDIAVSVKCEPQAADLAWVTVKVADMSLDPDYGVTVNEDGSVTLSGTFPVDGGDDGGDGGDGGGGGGED